MARDFECIVAARNKSVSRFDRKPNAGAGSDPAEWHARERSRRARLPRPTQLARFEARLAECGPLAYRVARGVLRNTAVPEGRRTGALLRAYRSFDRLRDRNRFRAWLVRICFASRSIACALLNAANSANVLWSQPGTAARRHRRRPAASKRIFKYTSTCLENCRRTTSPRALLAAMEGTPSTK